jgi:hypothetical protein
LVLYAQKKAPKRGAALCLNQREQAQRKGLYSKIAAARVEINGAFNHGDVAKNEERHVCNRNQPTEQGGVVGYRSHQKASNYLRGVKKEHDAQRDEEASEANEPNADFLVIFEHHFFSILLDEGAEQLYAQARQAATASITLISESATREKIPPKR